MLKRICLEARQPSSIKVPVILGRQFSVSIFPYSSIRYYVAINSHSNIKVSKFIMPLLKPLLLSVSFLLATNSAYGLNALTAKTINGEPPYLTFDGGVTKVYNVDALLSITLSDDTEIKVTDDTSSLEKPIELPNVEETFSTVKTVVPFLANNNRYPSYYMNNIIGPNNYWGDADGDTYDDITEAITVNWKDKNDRDITKLVGENPNRGINFCDAPYKLTISAGPGQLSTKYGDPKISGFNASSHTYYIVPNKADVGRVCFAEPNLSMQFDWDLDNFVTGLGFRVNKPSNSGNYWGANSVNNNNFPTTGAHGLFFYLITSGITPAEVVAINGSQVTASGSNVHLTLTATQTDKWMNGIGASSGTEGIGWYGPFPPVPAVKVQLSGPRYSSGDKSFSPVTFKLYADSSRNKLLYEFRLMRWYIVQPGTSYPGSKTGAGLDGQAQARSYCESFGYRLPNLNDYTNANQPDFGWREGFIDGFETAGDSYKRKLSYLETPTKWQGGILNEWGCLTNTWSPPDVAVLGTRYRCSGYPDSDWDRYRSYWTNSVATNPTSIPNGYALLVNSSYGNINYYSQDNYFDYRAVCVKP